MSGEAASPSCRCVRDMEKAMLSIGELSKRTGVKVPTIRYYEQMGLIREAGRSEGNQRRYEKTDLERLAAGLHPPRPRYRAQYRRHS